MVSVAEIFYHIEHEIFGFLGREEAMHEFKAFYHSNESAWVALWSEVKLLFNCFLFN